MEINVENVPPMLKTHKCKILLGFCALLLAYVTMTAIKKARKKFPPGPLGLPFVGYLPFLTRNLHLDFIQLREKYGDIFSVYLGPKYTIVLNEYSVAKEVLRHPGSLDRSPDIFKHFGNVGFAAENGERWIEQRKFSMSAVLDLGLGKKNWEILVMEELSILMQKLQQQKGKPFDMSDDLFLSLNASIFSLLFGRRLGVDEVDKLHVVRDFSHNAASKLGPLNPALLVPGLRKALQFLKIGGYDEAWKTVLQFRSFMKEQILRNKTSRLLRDNQSFINSYLRKISEMSETGNHAFSEAMLEGNLSLLFVATSDTIFSSLVWIFRFMCKCPDVQEKVYTELVDILGKDGRANYEERHNIPYTFAVLMEGQRHASIIALSTTRMANQDIPVGRFIIPKGSEITTNLWALHHDPTYWDEPEEFRPERFLTDGDAKSFKHPRSYAPYSIGKRNCPGEKIAWMTLLYYFSEIIRKFEISVPQGEQPEFRIINGLVTELTPQPLCFKERNI